jgi:hypothetical protein
VTAPAVPSARAARPSVSQRLITALDAAPFPVATAGPGARERVIVEQVIPLARSFEGVELTGNDISLLAWLIKSGEGAHFAELLSRVRHW